MRWLGNLAAEDGIRCYLVGGAVRDRILGKETNDIDIACEGDIQRLGERISRELGSDFIYYPAFKTGTIKSLDNARLDLASTRRETYPEQGRLPKVKPASIEEDLFRRDFTVNAIAQSLNPTDYGNILDPLNGRDDIKKGLIRIIHEKSFADDPTRIFRAVRYAERLNFKIERGTLRLLKKDIRRIGTLSGERLLYELKCIAKESGKIRPRIVEKLESLKALRFLGRPLSPPSPAALAKVVDNPCEFLCLLLSSYNEKGIDKLPLSKQCVLTIRTLRRRYEVLTKLKSLKKPSQIVSYLKTFDERGLRIISIIDKKSVSSKIKHFLEHYREVRIIVTGEDLKELGVKPGPGFKKILDELLSAKLDGLLKRKKDEVRMVKALVKSGVC